MMVNRVINICLIGWIKDSLGHALIVGQWVWRRRQHRSPMILGMPRTEEAYAVITFRRTLWMTFEPMSILFGVGFYRTVSGGPTIGGIVHLPSIRLTQVRIGPLSFHMRSPSPSFHPLVRWPVLRWPRRKV